jgi:membrane protein implicated in regulation of membrane protease activity
VFDERAPIIDAPFFYGPPVSFVLAPWLLLVLLLVGPFTLILTMLLILVAAGGLLTACAAVIASPYLLVRRLHGRGSAHVRTRESHHLLRQRRVLFGRFGSLQLKGVS